MAEQDTTKDEPKTGVTAGSASASSATTVPSYLGGAHEHAPAAAATPDAKPKAAAVAVADKPEPKAPAKPKVVPEPVTEPAPVPAPEAEPAPVLHPKEQARLDVAADIAASDEAAMDAALCQLLIRAGGSIRLNPDVLARYTAADRAIRVVRDTAAGQVYVQISE